MLEMDDAHWWYRGRRRVLAAMLDEFAPRPQARILDAGCGSGAELDQLARYGPVTGVDLSAASVEASRIRGHADVSVAAVEQLPFAAASFSLVTCLDVIEHTADDHVSLTELRRVTTPGGHAIVTVPAYQALWSAYDVANHHHRRYRRRSLAKAAEGAGWQVLRITAFNSLLLVPAAAVRLAERLRRGGAQREFDTWIPSRPVNAALELPNRIEAAWLRRGHGLPFGLSQLGVLLNRTQALKLDRAVGEQAEDADLAG